MEPEATSKRLARLSALTLAFTLLFLLSLAPATTVASEAEEITEIYNIIDYKVKDYYVLGEHSYKYSIVSEKGCACFEAYIDMAIIGKEGEAIVKYVRPSSGESERRAEATILLNIEVRPTGEFVTKYIRGLSDEKLKGSFSVSIIIVGPNDTVIAEYDPYDTMDLGRDEMNGFESEYGVKVPLTSPGTYKVAVVLSYNAELSGVDVKEERRVEDFVFWEKTLVSSFTVEEDEKPLSPSKIVKETLYNQYAQAAFVLGYVLGLAIIVASVLRRPQIVVEAGTSES